MANLNVQQQYVLSLLKEISGLRDQIDNLKLEVTAVRENSEEDAEHFHKLRADFKAVKEYADDFKNENRELQNENKELIHEIQYLKAENKALRESLKQSQTEHQIALEALHQV